MSYVCRTAPRGRLVRDGEADPPRTRMAAPEEMPALLRFRLAEVTVEVAWAHEPDELADRLVDLLDLVDAFAANMGITTDQLEECRQEKLSERGGFTERIVWLGNESS